MQYKILAILLRSFSQIEFRASRVSTAVQKPDGAAGLSTNSDRGRTLLHGRHLSDARAINRNVGESVRESISAF